MAKRNLREEGLAFSLDGKLLAAWGTYGLKLYSLTNGRALYREVNDRTLRCFAFFLDSRSYVTGHSKGRVVRWDVVTGNEIQSITISGAVPRVVQ